MSLPEVAEASMRFSEPKRFARSVHFLIAACLAALLSFVSGCSIVELDPGVPIPERRTVDNDTSVALYIPPDLTNQGLVFSLDGGQPSSSSGKPITTYPTRAIHKPWDDEQPSSSSGNPTETTILVGRAFTRYLDALVRARFPKATLYNWEPPLGTYDLLIQATISSRVEAEKKGAGATLNVEVEASLEISAKDGRFVTSLKAQGLGHHEVADLFRRVGRFWVSEGTLDEAQNTYDLGRIAGDQALRRLFGELETGMAKSPELTAHLAALAEERAQPSDLVARIRFEDAGALLPNQRLDAGETGQLVVDVENHGTGKAFAVALSLSSDLPEVTIPPTWQVGEMLSGQSREIRIPVKAGLKLPDGTAQILAEAQEKRGYNARKVQLEVPTVRLTRPSLQIAELLLDDRGGRAKGDGDGKPANGETLEAIVFVRNAGPGDAGSVELVVSSLSPQVEITNRTVALGTVPAGEIREGRFLVRLAPAFGTETLDLRVSAIEGRGLEVARGDLARSWPVLSRKPSIELSYRVFDGNSLASAGDRNGEINNGEQVEILLSAANRGQVAARDVTVQVASMSPEAQVRPDQFTLPDLPTGTESPPTSLLLTIPRTFEADRILLSLAIRQRDFPERLQEIGLPVRRKLPALALSLSVAADLQQGQRRQLQLQLENRGSLDARGVSIEIRTSWPNLEIIGEKSFNLGDLTPDSVAAPVALDIFAKRTAPLGKASLEVTVRQADFPPLIQKIPLPVIAENPLQIGTAPSVPERLGGGSGGVSARPAIFFRKYESGQIVADAEIVLTVEVQDPVGVALLRVTHNGRPVRLDPTGTSGVEGAASGTDSVTGREVGRYAIPVKLTPGNNDFEVTALNYRGGKETRTLRLIHTMRSGQVWAVIVGISRYEDPNLDLQFADIDAEAFAQYLTTDFEVRTSNLLLLKNEQATRRKIIETIGDWLPENAQANDTVLIYFAGHGASDEDPRSLDGLEKFLLPYDTAAHSYNSTAISFGELQRQINRIGAARIVFILDTCFSAAAAGGRTVFDREIRSRGVLTDGFLVTLSETGKGTILLMASGVNELAYEPAELGHGVFTYFLLEGLRGLADKVPNGNSDGLISADEAFLYTSRMVRQKTRNAQNPHKFGGGSGEIVIGRVTGKVR